MDLVMSLVLLIVLTFSKILTKPEVISSTVVTQTGTVQEVIVQKSNLVVGKNLLLRREHRAYHKILDEMRLS